MRVGEGCDPNLLGKNVGFLASMHYDKVIRAFSSFAVVPKESIIILNDKIDLNQGAYILANPLTANCLFSSIISKHKAIVQDTSASALGKIITKLCYKNNVKIINIVRRDENLKMLNDIGSTYTLNSTSETFWNDLNKAINDVAPKSIHNLSRWELAC